VLLITAICTITLSEFSCGHRIHLAYSNIRSFSLNSFNSDS
jgi:hypothetical protein